MKVSQIVSEHKKGVRAMKYAKKPQNTIAPKKPQKPVGASDEVKEGAAIQGEIVANDGKTITVAMPDGTQIQKPIAAAINKDAQGNATFNVMTPTASGAAPSTPQTPEQEFQRGQRIDINTGSDSTATMGEEQGSDPQMSALQKLLTTAQQPWEQAQIKWRMDNLKSQQSLAGEPGAGSGAPVDSRGNLIPVLPPKEWMAKNPNIVKQLPNNALPPEMQRPGMLDRIKSLAGIR